MAMIDLLAARKVSSPDRNFLVGSGAVVFLQGHILGPAKVVEYGHLADGQLGKEPLVVSRPVGHHRVTREEGLIKQSYKSTKNLPTLLQ